MKTEHILPWVCWCNQQGCARAQENGINRKQLNIAVSASVLNRNRGAIERITALLFN